MYSREFMKFRGFYKISFKLSFMLSVLFMLSLSGCASNTQRGHNDVVSSDNSGINSIQTDVEHKPVSTAEIQAKKASSSKMPDHPAQELTPELLYDLMLAEMALQRNDYALAFDKFYEAARVTGDSRLAKKATRVTLFSKNDAQTFKAVELWSELEPDNIDVLQIYASSLISKKQDEQAIVYLRRIISLSENFATGFKRSVATLDPIEERERTSRIFSHLTPGHENEPLVKLYQAKLAFKFADYPAAELSIDEALSIKPDYLDALILKVDLLKKQKKTSQAIKTLEKILEKLPENTVLRLELARLLVENNQYEQSFKQVKILASQDIPPEVLFAISLLSIETDQLDAAKQYLKRLHDYRLYASESAYFIGQLEAGRKNYAEAEIWFKQVVHGKYTFEAYLGLAVVYAQQEKFQQAFKLLDDFKGSSNKQSLEILQIKAEIHTMKKDYSQAYDVYTEALALSPNDPDVLYGRAMLAEKFGRIDLLEQDLHTIIAANPNDNQALNALGYTLANKTERYQEAFGYIERALQINPEDVATLDSMGWILYKMGKHQEAVKFMKKAYDKDPDPEIAAHYGEVLWAVGQISKAKTVWDKALKVDPQHQILIGTTARYLQ